jgi:hypothetical protein
VLYDAFISHASEDKEDFVRPLAERLRAERIEVWYDEFSLKVGDSLRRSIDRGLSQSRYGVVVLSPAFFRKQWSNWELDGLVARQNAAERDVILPVWRDVSRDDVLAFSPPLADKVALSADAGINEVVRGLSAVIKPQGSTLVIARDHLIEYGLQPPVVTDDWWLDMAAAAESNDLEDTFQSAMGWGRWGFPLPWADSDPRERGWRIARAALQEAWKAEADSRPITQITPPEIVHEFIASQPGLAEACCENLRYLLAYAPQLVIRGFGGQFEDRIEAAYRHSVERHDETRASGSQAGLALTVAHEPPRCDEDYGLRDDNFGGYDAGSVACAFVQGHAVMNGPQVRYYSSIDYLAWMLSDASRWLPQRIRSFLRLGMNEWNVWIWDTVHDAYAKDFGFEHERAPGTLYFGEAINKARERRTFKPTRKVRDALTHRLSFSSRILDLPESGADLTAAVLSDEFLTEYFDARERRRRERKERR